MAQYPLERLRDYAIEKHGAHIITSGFGMCECTTPGLDKAIDIISKALENGFNAKYDRMSRKITISYLTL